eukprot:CAMPEP_0172306700 /NCGR_PEP_ID=MMETSP1058-20130122/7714_1 /TAXON_ID=83371 /ORGANISM="Detonula confervacea, Strain CCMP 353" /LENGTH=370 /DNA_ID=CAMNT_0013018669 /DNA_START=56 /DNA_END=1165 /DNA_ORIENTATION=+
MTASFLHAASAKIIAEKLRDNKANFPADGPESDEKSRDALPLTASLRLLLVEEENGSNSSGIMTRTLAMDAAYSLVSGSSTPCRGCSKDVGGVETNDNNCPPGHTATEAPPMACRCCKVALLIPGEPKRTKKKRRLSGDGSKFLGGTGKVDFPMTCIRDGMGDGERWEPSLLGHIQIKYVNSLADVVRYLAYALSLPEHLQPLDGICLLGVGELLSRQNNNIMELTHILSMISDTAHALGGKRRELLNIDAPSLAHSEHECYGGNIAVLVAIDKCAYSSIPQKVIGYLHQWMDFIASIGPVHSDATTVPGEDATTPHSEWELVFKNSGVLELLPEDSKKTTEQETTFGFTVNLGNESGEYSTRPSLQIVW